MNHSEIIDQIVFPLNELINSLQVNKNKVHINQDWIMKWSYMYFIRVVDILMRTTDLHQWNHWWEKISQFNGVISSNL